jgi:hypothetical protein
MLHQVELVDGFEKGVMGLFSVGQLHLLGVGDGVGLEVRDRDDLCGAEKALRLLTMEGKGPRRALVRVGRLAGP